MTVINKIQTPSQKQEPLAEKAKKQDNNLTPSFAEVVFLFVLKCMNDALRLGYQSAKVQTDALNENAKAQLRRMSFAQGIHFITMNNAMLYTQKQTWVKKMVTGQYAIPAGSEPIIKFGRHLTWVQTEKQVKKSAGKIQNMISQINIENNRITAVHSAVEDQVSLLRQDAQQDDTMLNGDVNNTTQVMQEYGSVMQILTALTNQTTRI